ncbi:MAG: YiiX/YebB-like N1pC/P60 family cysteine hydrolase [Desulfosarcinaceae bacterium]|nr:YiiX/YebB-like N1pC/P60 family cysteine hydrolase [Desulfosarcinaceae bacterium]
MAKKRYAAYRDQLKTGDIVLFSGKGGISAGIKWLTLNRWSHVGMVLILPEYDFVCLWESTTLNRIEDLDTGRYCKGVQLVPLRARVQQYDGDIAVRQLEGVNIVPDHVQELMRLRAEMRDKPYEQDKLELAKAAYDGPFGGNTEDLTSVFCSELVAEAYQRLGLLREPPAGMPSNEYVPADFSEKRQRLDFIRGQLGPEIELTVTAE